DYYCYSGDDNNGLF
nr:immunoglobulin light chain junction region [Macaca mulatta]MOW18511.1 immunoglobulin light chain junction region [Macaca mulatta]MOY07976.1 immunoglobulin light chain junction region [Macaca mulatta]